MPVILTVKAKPGSKTNQLMLDTEGNFQVKIKAPATDGKANAALISYLSTLLGIPKSAIVIVSGAISQFKRLEIDADAETVKKTLQLEALKK